MVASNSTQSIEAQLARCSGGLAAADVESYRAGRPQAIGELMSQVLSRYLPPEEVRRQQVLAALRDVSAAAG
jgi:hypothetical protein